MIEARGGWIPTTRGKYKRSDPTQLGPCYPRPAVAKRSPILGYNHNVRYRGLIFHVQTEDSGLLSPHLFTHLFYEGVIISTRKLVYDAGADEGAIKSLMQAQHKAVMKDLKRGAFDDKMDVNLAGNPGLLPRGVKEAAEAEPLRDSQPLIPMPQAYLTEPGIEIVREDEPLPLPVRGTDTVPELHPPSDPYDDIALPVAAAPPSAVPPAPPPVVARTKTPAPVMIQPRNSSQRIEPEVASPRTITADRRGSGPPADLEPPVIAEDPASLAAEMFAASSTARPYSQASAPEIELYTEDPPRRRTPHDTEVEMSTLAAIEDAPRVSDGVPMAPPPSPSLPPPIPRAPLSAATLPPSRPLLRPPTRPPMRPSVPPPTVVSRPLQERQRGESDAVEVYAPPPASVDPPPGLGERERAGQYAQHKRSRQFPIVEAPLPPPTPPAMTPPPPRERSASIPIPAGLGRPQRPSPTDPGRPLRPSPTNLAQPPRLPTTDSGGRPLRPPQTAGSGSIPRPVPRDPTPAPPLSSGVPQPMGPQHTLPRGTPPTPNRDSRPPVGRTPTPQRIQSTQPLARPGGSGGVVMTRPAVIVGAPAKPATQRVRKAREEEGRGFGQGLISEKSLDEVILAYLSEDADDK